MNIPNSLRLPLLFLAFAPILSAGADMSKAAAAGTSDTPARYTMMDMRTLPGDVMSQAWGINTRGQVIGESFTRFHSVRTFVFQDGKMRALRGENASAINSKGQIVGVAGTDVHAILFDPGSRVPHTLPNIRTRNFNTEAINERGQIVGEGDTVPGPEHAFEYSGGKLTDLGMLKGDVQSTAHAINDGGQIVGHSDGTSDHMFVSHAVLFGQGGKSLFNLGTLPHGVVSDALAINNQGQIVGSIFCLDDHGYAGLNHAVLFHRDGTPPTDLGTLPGDTRGEATAINDQGQIVGVSFGSFGYDRAHAVLFRIGTQRPTDLNLLLSKADHARWILRTPTGINNKGQICGTGEINGQQHAFLLTPMPAGK